MMSAVTRVSSAKRWWGRVAAAVTGAVLTLIIPVHAWAASKNIDGVVIEAAKYRRSRGGIGFFGFAALCCLLVVGGVVLIVFLITRNRRNNRRP
jgi:hypothetical protein